MRGVWIWGDHRDPVTRGLLDLGAQSGYWGSGVWGSGEQAPWELEGIAARGAPGRGSGTGGVSREGLASLGHGEQAPRGVPGGCRLGRPILPAAHPGQPRGCLAPQPQRREISGEQLGPGIPNNPLPRHRGSPHSPGQRRPSWRGRSRAAPAPHSPGLASPHWGPLSCP